MKSRPCVYCNRGRIRRPLRGWVWAHARCIPALTWREIVDDRLGGRDVWLTLPHEKRLQFLMYYCVSSNQYECANRRAMMRVVRYYEGR